MTKKVDTWMPFLVDKYLGDTSHLTTEQHGAYCLLLLAMWKQDGALPNIDDQLRTITRLTPAHWRVHKPLLMKFFRIDGESITQKRLSQELKRAKQSTNAKSEAGSKGAAKRWHNDGTGNGETDSGGDDESEADWIANRSQEACQTDASIHTSSTSLRSVETLTPHTHSADSTAAGRVCGAMRRAGMADVQSGHPDLLALLEAGATEAEFVGAAAESVKREKGFAYAIGMLKRQRQDAAKSSNGMHHGPMPGIPVNCDQVDATSGYLAEEAAHRTEVEKQRLARIAAQQGGPA